MQALFGGRGGAGLETGSCWAGLTRFCSDPTELTFQPGPAALSLEKTVCSSSAAEVSERQMTSSESLASRSAAAAKVPVISTEIPPPAKGRCRLRSWGFAAQISIWCKHTTWGQQDCKPSANLDLATETSAHQKEILLCFPGKNHIDNQHYYR